MTEAHYVSDELTIEEQLVLADALRGVVLFIGISSDTRPMHVQADLHAKCVSIAKKNGLAVEPSFPNGVSFIVPDYDYPPTKRASDLEPGDVIVRYGARIRVENVSTTSGGITYVNDKAMHLFSSDHIEIEEGSESNG